MAAEVADVQAGRALVAQAGRVAGQRREDGAGLVGRQELLRLLAGHGEPREGRAGPERPQPAAMRKRRLRACGLPHRPAAGSGRG